MAYAVFLQPRAVKALSKLPRDLQSRIKQAIVDLGDAPRPHDATKLAGQRETWRIRVGDYRILYVPDDARQAVVVTVIGHRRDVYRQ